MRRAVHDEWSRATISFDVATKIHVRSGVVVAVLEPQRHALVWPVVKRRRARADPRRRPEDGRRLPRIVLGDVFVKDVAARCEEKLFDDLESSRERARGPSAHAELIRLEAAIRVGEQRERWRGVPRHVPVEEVTPCAPLRSPLGTLHTSKIQNRSGDVGSRERDLRGNGLLVVVVDDGVPAVVTGERQSPVIGEYVEGVCPTCRVSRATSPTWSHVASRATFERVKVL